MRTMKTTVLFSQARFQQSKYLKKNEDWRFFLKFEDFWKKAAGLRHYGRKEMNMKMEIWVRFNAGEIFKDFVVLDMVKFKVPKLKWF